jgi:hypothetical protein
MKFSPRVHMIAALAVSSVLASTAVVWAGSNFVSTQQSAQAQVIDTIASGKERVTALTERAADLELAIKNAQTVLTDSSGKVLDDATRTALEKSIAQAERTLTLQRAQLKKLKAAVTTLTTAEPLDLLWPYGQQLRAEEIEASNTTGVDVLVKAVMALGEGIQTVQGSQTAWQAEQDRIAAEQAAAQAAAAQAQAAAARAAARNAATKSTLSESGGGTAPSAPAPPTTEPVIVSQSFNVESYVAALAPNSYITWVTDLCIQYYACGEAWVGGRNTTPVEIRLDPAKREIYANTTGISVLVHEAAHARQWWTYGGRILDESLSQAPQFTAPAGATAEEQLAAGKRAVEYMADCATIGKLGYSTGAYTTSCTPDQLSRISGIW